MISFVRSEYKLLPSAGNVLIIKYLCVMQCILREHKADIGTGGVVGLFRARGLLLFGGVDGMGVRCFNNFLTEK